VSETDLLRNAVVKWARESAAPLDLAPLGSMIGDARVVALGEAEHLIAEPLEFRNRLLQYLVEKKGFTAIAIESGIVESRAVHEYVRGGPGDLATVLAEGISWTFDALASNQALIRWMREHNESARHPRKINFYGFDVPGSPGNPKARRTVDTALVTVLTYLARVDPQAASAFHGRLDTILPDIRLNPYRLTPDSGYRRLSRPERDSLTATLSDAIALLQRCEARFTAASSADDYEWACRAAVGAWQVDQWLRQVGAGSGSSEDGGLFDLASDLRDRAQADNLEWILEREGPSGKLLVYGHNNHLSAAPIKRSWRSESGASGIYTREVAGTYLRRRLGTQLLTIGNAIGQDALGRAESLDGFASEVGMSQFLIDLRMAPARVAGWLDAERQIGKTYAAYNRYQIHSAAAPRQAFDILYFVDRVTMATVVAR
jgi:erythromycin esterase